MPSINMIAVRRAEKVKLEKQARALLLGIFVEIAITLGILSFMTARIIGAGVSLDRLSSDLKKIEPTVNKITFYEARISELVPRLDLLADSRESTMLWSDVMYDMSRSVASDTWLSSMTSTRVSTPASDPKMKPEEKVVVTLAGTSLDQRLVGETMLRLGQYPEIDRVDLNFTRKNASNEMEAVDFDLAATLKSKESAKREGAGDAEN